MMRGASGDECGSTIDPEVIDPGGRSVEDSPVKSDFTFYLCANMSLVFILSFTSIYRLILKNAVKL
jgi:hypothetical protein